MQEEENGEKLNLIRPCHAHGDIDLCDENICDFDGQCKSGCCTQVLTKDYSRCTPMLVGDYCPRALDPIHDMLVKEEELEIARQAMSTLTEAAVAKDHEAAARHVEVPPESATELPCNVFGTVDRCDGMSCEHDGHCFSGCCSLFVSGD